MLEIKAKALIGAHKSVLRLEMILRSVDKGENNKKRSQIKGKMKKEKTKRDHQ